MARQRPAPYGADPQPQMRVLTAAAVQLRSKQKQLPKTMLEIRRTEIDPARRRNPLSAAWGASSTGGDAGETGGGGSGIPPWKIPGEYG